LDGTIHNAINSYFISRYLDHAIKYAVRDLPSFDPGETSEIVFARQLRSQCLLLENRYAEAQAEAENCIRQKKDQSITALYVQAEALYFQCQASTGFTYKVVAVSRLDLT
jgi:hypothetical protein